MTNHQKCFDFLKQGHDKQFESAMKSIDSMYDNLFNGDKLDKLFENLKYEDNPITEPIDEMTKQIFNTEQKPEGPVYIKAQVTKKQYDDDSDFVVGQPLYHNNQVPNPYPQMTPNPNPYTAQPIQPQPQYQQYKDNFTNPYYANKGQNNYFENWSNNNSQR